MISTSRFTHLVFVAIAFLFAACSTSTAPTQNTGGPGGTIYFHDIPSNIASLNLTSGVVTTVCYGDMPNVRPDKWILCVVANDLTLISPDGAQNQIIRHHSQMGGYDAAFHGPQLSPDGRYIAYDQSAAWITYIVDASSGALITTIGDATTSEYYLHPTWGKDGSLYVQGVPSGSTQPDGGIFKIDKAFQSMIRLDKNLNTPKKPSVSPDGTTIAFILSNHLWTMNIDGSNAKQLTTSGATEDDPAWSPDSKWIAIGDNACDIFLVPTDGGNAIDVAVKCPGSMGTGGAHCPSSNDQMDWK